MTIKKRMDTQVATRSDDIDEDFARAKTIPSRYYCDPAIYERAIDRIFARSWQFATDLDQLKVPGQVISWTKMEGSLNEPLLLSRDENDEVHCLSNVCTHRGAQLVESDCVLKQIRCRYHGRRFGLDGDFITAPGFEDVQDFPCPSDNLAKIPMETWGKFVFVSLDPAYSFDQLFGDIKKRLHWLPLDEYRLAREHNRDYFVHANWALYCDNYLEGMHVPFVHPSLASLLDTRQYRTEVYGLSSLQIGPANNPADAFDLPPDSPDYGQSIAAYYYFVFPNMMWNFYPWGLSINVVQPVGVDKTRIRFITYVYDEKRMQSYSPRDIDQTEREDEAVVELVQRGVRSRLYDRGRYSVRWEQGVHHFHRLLKHYLDD